MLQTFEKQSYRFNKKPSTFCTVQVLPFFFIIISLFSSIILMNKHLNLNKFKLWNVFFICERKKTLTSHRHTHTHTLKPENYKCWFSRFHSIYTYTFKKVVMLNGNNISKFIILDINICTQIDRHRIENRFSVFILVMVKPLVGNGLAFLL